MLYIVLKLSNVFNKYVIFTIYLLNWIYIDLAVNNTMGATRGAGNSSGAH
jgi:hypothetical protein